MNKMIGITIGDPSGVGPEVTLKALASSPEVRDDAIVFGTPSVMERAAAAVGTSERLHVISSVREFQPGAVNVLDVVDEPAETFPIGVVNPASGDAAYRYLERAIGLAMDGEIGPVVTAPLNKEALHLGGHNFDGHTEIFATLTGTKRYAMMLWCEKLAVIHVSTHVALREACNRATKARVLECIGLAEDALHRLGVDHPRIAVAGLNPHSGEAGLFGDEEIREIGPAVEEAQARGLDVTGPVPPDTVFLKAVQGQFDMVVAMYHDQGHIPMKLLAFDEGVNVTLGLPIIRTSVDHGTAFDIAGTGKARENSMLAAIRLARRFNGTR